MNLNPEIIKIKDTIIKTRRDFHKHPELSFQEKRTSKIVGDKLENKKSENAEHPLFMKVLETFDGEIIR